MGSGGFKSHNVTCIREQSRPMLCMMESLFHFSPEPEIFSTDFLFFLPLIILGSMFLPTLAGALALYGSMPALHSNIRRPLVAMRLVDHTPPPTANVDRQASVSRLLSAPRSQNLPKLDEADQFWNRVPC